jgi:cysteine-rich repeat protein
MMSGGMAGGSAARGGVAGHGGNGTGGNSTGGNDTGGTGGNGTGGSGASGNSGDGGTAGASGETSGGESGGGIGGGGTSSGGPIPVVSLGERCNDEGALGCNGHAQKTRLICEGGEWVENGTCTSNENCDTRNGLCATLQLTCRSLAPGTLACFTTERGRCGPDLVTVEERVTCVDTRCRSSVNGADCAPPYCGDGVVQAPEEDCDDNNYDDDDGCNTACQFPSCGDGFVEAGEDCDDANDDDTDDCPSTCNFASCGDGFVHQGVEECDDADEDNEDGCTTRCAPPRCGDGFLRPSEPCDDGNPDNGDGCSSTCTLAWPVQAVTGNQTCALMSDGSVRCWGQNNYGQLGQGDTQDTDRAPGKALNFGKGRTATRLAAGSSHICALLDDESLKCWGYNLYGGLGLGNVGDQHVPNALPVDFGGRAVLSVAAGSQHTCAVLEDGALECFGYNEYGQLGLGIDATAVKTPTDPVDLGSERHATAVAAGTRHTCAILDDGTVKCWGSNEFGQLGIGTTGEDVLVPSLVDLGPGRSAQALFAGSLSTCAILDDESLVCWGYNGNGVLGVGDSTQGSLPDPTAVDLGAGRRAEVVSIGAHACALLDDGSVKCWGGNNHGQLGLGAATTYLLAPPATPVDLGTGRKATQVTAAGYNSCVVLDNDTLKCWGFNMFGQLGLGDALDRGLADGEMGDDLPAIVVWNPPP